MRRDSLSILKACSYIFYLICAAGSHVTWNSAVPDPNVWCCILLFLCTLDETESWRIRRRTGRVEFCGTWSWVDRTGHRLKRTSLWQCSLKLKKEKIRSMTDWLLGASKWLSVLLYCVSVSLLLKKFYVLLPQVKTWNLRESLFQPFLEESRNVDEKN